MNDFSEAAPTPPRADAIAGEDITETFDCGLRRNVVAVGTALACWRPPKRRQERAAVTGNGLVGQPFDTTPLHLA